MLCVNMVTVVRFRTFFVIPTIPAFLSPQNGKKHWPIVHSSNIAVNLKVIY